VTTGGTVTARADGDAQLHAALDGDAHCMCGAPIRQRLPQPFTGRGPTVCVVCALAEAVRQTAHRANAAANAAATTPQGRRALSYRSRRP
jgi:hypothetical protein